MEESLGIERSVFSILSGLEVNQTAIIHIFASNSHCALPTFIKVKGQEMWRVQKDLRETAQKSARLNYNTAVAIFLIYTLKEIWEVVFRPFPLGSFSAGISYKETNLGTYFLVLDFPGMIGTQGRLAD